MTSTQFRGGWRSSPPSVPRGGSASCGSQANQKLLLNDSLYYSIQAGLNSEGSWFKDALTGQPGAEHGMLTSLYLTPWSLGDGDNVFRQRFAMTLLGIATVALIGLAGVGSRAVDGARRAHVRAGRLGRGRHRSGVSEPLDQRLGRDVESLALMLVSASLSSRWGIMRNPTVRSGLRARAARRARHVTRSEIGLCIPVFSVLSAAVSRRRCQPPLAGAAILVGRGGDPGAVDDLQRRQVPRARAAQHERWEHAARGELRHDVLRRRRRVGHHVPRPARTGGPRARTWGARRIASVRRSGARWRSSTSRTTSTGLPVVDDRPARRLVDLYGLDTLVRLDVGEEKAEWAVWAGIVCW